MEGWQNECDRVTAFENLPIRFINIFDCVRLALLDFETIVDSDLGDGNYERLPRDSNTACHISQTGQHCSLAGKPFNPFWPFINWVSPFIILGVSDVSIFMIR